MESLFSASEFGRMTDSGTSACLVGSAEFEDFLRWRMDSVLEGLRRVADFCRIFEMIEREREESGLELRTEGVKLA